MLAQCCVARSGSSADPGATEFHLLRAAGDYFAMLSQEDGRDRYVLRTLANARLHLWGSFDHHAVNITDDSQDLVATTEACSVVSDPTGQYYRIRAGPLVDVGLVLCSLLC